jgi:hypothetical protein
MERTSALSILGILDNVTNLVVAAVSIPMDRTVMLIGVEPTLFCGLRKLWKVSIQE